MKKIVYNFVVTSILLFITSCTSDVMDMLMPSTRTCHLLFNGGFSNYEDEPTTRAAVSVQNGAVMYLLFPNNVTGKATYNNGSWTLTYEGTIAEGACSAYYFSEVEKETSTIVTLKNNVPIYGTDEGECTVATNGDITVKAQLKPICSRVRFRGDANTTVTCNNSYQTYSSYTISTGKLESKSESINTISINSNGYSDYYYYTSMPSAMTITIDGTNYSAAIPFPSTPKSVCLNLPTKSNLNGWTKESADDGNMRNGHEYVDLGLPSGLKWATCNVGANAPEEFGDYYVWGDTETKVSYNWSNYKWCNGTSTTITKYCDVSSYGNVDNKMVLDLEDDAAHVKWGGDWRMPTKEEQDELRTKCTWTWTKQNGVAGYKVSGLNGSSLFLPAAGFQTKGEISSESHGYYWSSSLFIDKPDRAYCIDICSSSVTGDGNHGRDNSRSIRPVWSEPIKISSISLSESSLSLEVGGTHTLLPTISPSNATNQSLTWSSSNTSVATVTQSGQITAIKSGTSTITATANDGSGVKATCSVSVSANSQPHIHSGHEYVDLGLPSGLKWATCNVGASKPEEYGDYFAWGETEPYYTEGHSQDNPCSNWKTGKTGYNWASYKWCNGSSSTLTKYCTSSSYGTVDNKTVLDLEDDAAHVNWGGEWRMPTKEEQDELRTKCTWTWGSQNGVNGYTVVGPNGNSLFLPAAGYRYNSDLLNAGSLGFYWSSSLLEGNSRNAYELSFFSSSVRSSYGNRQFGQSVRPVCP